MELLKAVIITFLSSAAVFGFIQFLISRHDNKNDALKEIKDAIAELQEDTKKAEKDSVRLQLLVLLSMYPNDEKEIIDVGERYFKGLEGNWYATPLFYKWCLEKGIKPEWFHYKGPESSA